METTDTEDLLRALHEPAAWPWPVGDIRRVETHISRVFIGGDHAIKLKRPVRYSFVDYSTLEKRRQACLDEVRLNRLLSDDIYLGTVPILRDGDRYRIGSQGEDREVVEWATLMRRIDDHHLLSNRLREGTVPDNLADRLADRLIPFHQQRPSWGNDEPDTTLTMLLEVLTDNLDELHPFAGDPLPSNELGMVGGAVRDFLTAHHGLLRERILVGWVREGHGDLRCEHVVVDDNGVQVIDCTEFNVDLRRADVVSDLAFLLMDLARLGAGRSVVERLVERYRAAEFDLPVSLLRLYWIHRALVRAKVLCLRLPDLDGPERSDVARRAVDYLHLACQQAVGTKPAVIVMTGLSGSGKSTVATGIAQVLGVETDASDDVRKALAGQERSTAVSWGQGIYTPEWTERTYERLLDRGRAQLLSGHPAVLDATFLERNQRDRAAAMAAGAGVPMVLVEVTCEEDVLIRRLEERSRRGDSVSDASVDIYRKQRDRQASDPPRAPEGALHVVIDTTPEGPVSLDALLDVLVDAEIVLPGIRGDGTLMSG